MMMMMIMMMVMKGAPPEGRSAVLSVTPDLQHLVLCEGGFARSAVQIFVTYST